MINEMLGPAPESQAPVVSPEHKQLVIKRAGELEAALRNLYDQSSFSDEVSIRRQNNPASMSTEVIEQSLQAVREETVRLAAMLLISACESDPVSELAQKPHEPVLLG